MMKRAFIRALASICLSSFPLGALAIAPVPAEAADCTLASSDVQAGYVLGAQVGPLYMYSTYAAVNTLGRCTGTAQVVATVPIGSPASCEPDPNINATSGGCRYDLYTGLVAGSHTSVTLNWVVTLVGADGSRLVYRGSCAGTMYWNSIFDFANLNCPL